MAKRTKPAIGLVIGEEGSFVIPVSLSKIPTESEVPLDSASPDGNPIKEVKLDIVTGETVAYDAVQKGIFMAKPKKSDRSTWSDFRAISPDDLDVIADATEIPDLVIDHFIPLADVPFERVTDAYFLSPADGTSAKPLVLLARALKKKKRAGVFKMSKTSRQYLAVVYEKDGGLIVNTIAFSSDFAQVREAHEALARQGVKIRPEEQRMAEALIDVLASDAAVLDTFEDDLLPLKADLVERAIRGTKLPPKRKRKEREAVNADDALEAKLRETLSRTKSGSHRGAPVPA